MTTSEDETIVSYRKQIMRPAWELRDMREADLRNMRRTLVMEALDKGYIPTDLPQETRRYYVESFGELAPEETDIAPAQWDSIIVTLTMPIRRAPSADRVERGQV